jgi:septal ring factor EnvC (AmiA/AmiB activator)
MSDADFSLMIEILPRMQGPLNAVQLKLGDMETRITLVEEATSSMSARIASLEVGVAAVLKRLYRHEHRLDRIETRLGLIAA